ncbi:hypothetical protein M378DRAFT_16054 [Amanita muscaria Koide BX008]|uniref:Uncharacterized protein n=1 Tax=Amanita muscaria (strain Koide BX008) TaxID=946122 RepID=A0A0C2S4W4_AMAMK|nr:hypothetical protein M378DRAFT_16054 [Amanita muscaria Koide BX008]
MERQLQLPLHLKGCTECARFMKHIIANTKYGGLDVFKKLQRDHWVRTLDGELQNTFNRGYDRALDKSEARVNELQDDNDDLRAQIKELEQNNAHLTEQLRSAPKENKWTRLLSFDGKSSVGEEPSRNKKSKTSKEQKPAPKGKGKQQASDDKAESKHGTDCELYLQDDDDDDLEYCGLVGTDPNAQYSEIPLQASLLSRLESDQPPRQTTSQPSTSTSTRSTTEATLVPPTSQRRDTNAWHTSQRAGTSIHRPTPFGQVPNVTMSNQLDGPSAYRLHDWKDMRLNTNGHVSMGDKHCWAQDPSKLWKVPLRYWGSGKPLQLAREASRVPFDQRSLAQRWAVCMATKDKVLPEGFASKEPNVEDDKVLAQAPKNIQVVKGRLNAHDVTVWLFLLMTQPEAKEGTSLWFWYIACLLFAEQGKYTEVLKSLNITHRNDDYTYCPQRFVHAGHWTIGDVASHFYNCGLRPKDANTLFFHFTSSWIGKLDKPPTVGGVPLNLTGAKSLLPVQMSSATMHSSASIRTRDKSSSMLMRTRSLGTGEYPNPSSSIVMNHKSWTLFSLLLRS